MTNTITSNPENPENPKGIDFRTIPNWAIPQLAYIRNRLNGIITSTFLPINDDDSPNTNRLGFVILVNDYGGVSPLLSRYVGSIYKKDMSNPNFIPPLYGTY